MTNKAGIVSPHRDAAHDQVFEPPMRLIVTAVALGMIVGAFIGDAPASDQQSAASAAAVVAEIE